MRSEVSQNVVEEDAPGFGRFLRRPSDGRLDWSPGLSPIFGSAIAPASEAEFLACLHPDDRVRVERETEAFLTGDADNFCHGFRIVRTDGRIRDILDRGRIERDAEHRGAVAAEASRRGYPYRGRSMPMPPMRKAAVGLQYEE